MRTIEQNAEIVQSKFHTGRYINEALVDIVHIPYGIKFNSR